MYEQEKEKEQPANLNSKIVDYANKVVDDVCLDCSNAEIIELYNAIRIRIIHHSKTRIKETKDMLLKYEQDQSQLENFLKEA